MSLLLSIVAAFVEAALLLALVELGLHLWIDDDRPEPRRNRR